MPQATSDHTTPIQLALNRLLRIAENTGYQVEWVPGKNGCYCHWLRPPIIELGRDLLLPQQLVVLAHELGHARDYILNFPQPDELLLLAHFWENYRLGDFYYSREQQAWVHAKEILHDLGIWPVIQPEFDAFKEQSLGPHYQKLLAAKEKGQDKPNESDYFEAWCDMIERIRTS